MRLRLTTKNKDLNGSLEVRNWLDKVEDKIGPILDRPEAIDFIARRALFAGLWGHTNYPADLDDEAMKKLIRELL